MAGRKTASQAVWRKGAPKVGHASEKKNRTLCKFIICYIAHGTAKCDSKNTLQ
jgi:hypothetical protein